MDTGFYVAIWQPSRVQSVVNILAPLQKIPLNWGTPRYNDIGLTWLIDTADDEIPQIFSVTPYRIVGVFGRNNP